jgi:hypothetical protein
MDARDPREDRRKATVERPEVELYDPFDSNFVTRRRDDPLARLYDKKIINDDF